MQRSLGLTLLELLLSLTLGLLLSGLALKIYAVQLSSNHALQDQLFLQNHCHLAVLLLSADIRTAGYSGCVKLRQGMTSRLTPENRVDLTHHNQIIIRKIATQVTKSFNNQLFGVANCQQLQIVSANKLANLDKQNHYIAPFLLETFSLKPITGEGKSLFALYKKTNQDQALELVPGIDRLQANWISQNTIVITLHLTAPHGATMTQTFDVTLRA